MNNPGTITALMLSSYLIGAMPFGLWVTKALKRVDIREVGSGNIGATNVLRVAGWRVALLVFLLDAGKGAVGVIAARALADAGALSHAALPPIMLGAGMMSLLGHTFSIFLGMRGGRGVATGFGMMVALAWPAALSALALFIAVAFLSRIVSLSSIVSAAATPLFMLLYHQPPFLTGFSAVAATIVIALHAPNIGRLLRGQESRIGQRAGHRPTAAPESQAHD